MTAQGISAEQLYVHAGSNCGMCGGSRITTAIHRHTFTYGIGGDAVDLTADVPVRRCGDCGFEFLDDEGQRLKDEAVRRHHGVLTPRDVRDVRRAYGMTRKEFAEISGIGTASLHRWENGLSVQTYAYDRYLRLLATPRIMGRLQSLVATIRGIDATEGADNNRWQCLDAGDTELFRDRCREFQLRLVA